MGTFNLLRDRVLSAGVGGRFSAFVGWPQEGAPVLMKVPVSNGDAEPAGRNDEMSRKTHNNDDEE